MNSSSGCESLVIQRNAAVNPKKKKLLDMTLQGGKVINDSCRLSWTTLLFHEAAFKGEEPSLEISSATLKKKRTGGVQKSTFSRGRSFV